MQAYGLLALWRSLAQISLENHHPFQSLQKSLMTLVETRDSSHVNLQCSTQMIGHFLHTQTEMSEMVQQAYCLLRTEQEQGVPQASAHRETHLAAFHKDSLSIINVTKLK